MRNQQTCVFGMIIGCLCAIMCINGYGQVTKVPNGIIVTTNQQQIALLTVNNTAFCLSLNTAGTPTVINSVFLDEQNKTASCYTVFSKAPLYGISTSYGRLVINATTGQWSLYNSTGKKLVSDGVFSFTDSSITIIHQETETLYGAGNKSTKQLEKESSASSTGNGVTDLPYFWSTAGYSCLGVSEDDNKPVRWVRATTSKEVSWKFQGKAANLYLWPAQSMYDAASSYIKITGKPKVPPKWAFGYLQSQWGWTDSAYIANVATQFRSHKLPVDAFIIDFEWYTGFPDYFMKKEGNKDFNDFGFSSRLFPHPAKQLADLQKQGIDFIGIRKPRLGNKYFLDTARANGWLKSPDNPDADRDLNFNSAALRKWYGAKTRSVLDAGVDAWWNDEGESYYTCYYGWNTAQFDLLAAAQPNYRHFTLNRAFNPGNQRFGYCTWTGDILSTWKSLSDVPKDLLNFSLAGMYYGSCDIGGFSGSHDPQVTKEMLVRWFQAGVFLPIMRSHSNVETTPHFPYLWGRDGEAAIQKALNLRYRLLPYIYSLGHEAYNSGAPIMRPLVMEFPDDTAVANMTDEWLLGKGLLVAPVMNEGGKRTVYLPAGEWYNFNTNEKIDGDKSFAVTEALDETPIYVHAGTILTLGPVLQHTKELSDEPLEVHIYPGQDAKFELIEDDGVSYNYMKGDVRRTTFIWNDKTRTLSWNVSGPYKGSNTFRNLKAIIDDQQKEAVLSRKGSMKF